MDGLWTKGRTKDSGPRTTDDVLHRFEKRSSLRLTVLKQATLAVEQERAVRHAVVGHPPRIGGVAVHHNQAGTAVGTPQRRSVDADPLRERVPLSQRVIATNKRAFHACLAARSTVAAVLHRVRKRARKRRRRPHPPLPQRWDEAGTRRVTGLAEFPTLCRRPLAPRQGRVGIHMDDLCRWRRLGGFNSTLTVAENFDGSFGVSVFGRFTLGTSGSTCHEVYAASRSDRQIPEESAGHQSRTFVEPHGRTKIFTVNEILRDGMVSAGVFPPLRAAAALPRGRAA